MIQPKPKAIHDIEERMENTDPESFRYKVLESAKGFKSSWIELGQYLFTVYKDKLYKDWGYLTFEAYCAKEIGIRQATAVKLLKSYAFLETEEPQFLKRENIEDRQPKNIPSVDAVNSLRLAKSNEDISEKDYRELREDVLDDAKDDDEVKKKIKYILKAKTRPDGPEDTVQSASWRRILKI
jgi:hypothetical protein